MNRFTFRLSHLTRLLVFPLAFLNVGAMAVKQSLAQTSEPRTASEKNEIAPSRPVNQRAPFMFKGHVMIKKPAVVESPYKPKPAGTAAQRLEDAKKLHEEAIRQKVENVRAEIFARVEHEKELLERYVTEKSTKDNPLAIEHQTKVYQDAKEIKEAFEQNHVLPLKEPKSKAFRQYQLDGFRRQLALQLPTHLTRTRLAYSDLIRELRMKGDGASAERLEDEGKEFLKNAGYALKGKVETWKELYSYDFTILANGVSLYLSPERRSEWRSDRMCEGLGLPPESPSAPFWKELDAYYVKDVEIGEKLRPIEHSRSRAAWGTLFGAAQALAADPSSAEEVTGFINGQPIYQTNQERLNEEFESRAEGEQKFGESIQSLGDTLTKISNLKKELDAAALPIQSHQERYLRRRADQLQLPDAADRLEILFTRDKITVVNKTDEELYDVEIHMRGEGLDAVPSDLPRRIEVARLAYQKAHNIAASAALNRSIRLKTLHEKQKLNAQKELDELRQLEKCIQGSLKLRWVLHLPPKGKETLYRNDYLNMRNFEGVAVCNYFIWEFTVPATAKAPARKVIKK